MPRSIYYQDTGNPIQPQRLPRTSSTIALAAPGVPFKLALAAVIKMAGLLLAIVIASMVFLEVDFYRTASVGRSLYLFGAVTLALGCWASVTRSPTAIALLAAYFAANAMVVLDVSVDIKILVAALAVSCFSWLFAQHWVAVCTASPLSRITANALKRTWALPIAITACTPIALALISWFTDQPMLAVAIAAVMCLVQIVANRPTTLVAKLWGAWESLVSWCTYNSDGLALPGIVQSPVGSCRTRLSIMCVAVALATVAYLHILLPQIAPPTETTPIHQVSNPAFDPAYLSQTMPADQIPILVVCCLLVPIAPLLASVAFPITLMVRLLAEARRLRTTSVRAETWSTLVHDLQHSPNPHENRSYYQGRVVQDGSPLIVPRQVFCEHAHFPGDSGTGKTALGLAPWVEQTILFGDCSLIVVDLKADSLELFAALIAARDALRRRTGQLLPLKYFTSQSHLSTYAFNPLTQPYWNDFDPYSKTDILCGAAGLLYGTDYGPGWYSAANAAVLHHAIKQYPHVTTIRELAERVRYCVINAKKTELHPELRNAGVHVQAILDRLGSFDALNAAPGTGFSPDVLNHAIDLRDVFRRPQIHYFHLSATLAAGSAPEIARLLVYSLLCASTQTKRECPVFLVIDEFQRMVAHNVEYLLQLARSMGVGVILANQSMQDLGDLIPAVEANCRYRQWFSVSSLEDRERLIRSSGETVEPFISVSNGTSTSTTTLSEQVMVRLSHNDIALASDHPLRSIVRISRGAGYAQYGGLPFVIQSNYHISTEEYQRRKNMAWPELSTGTFIPRDHRKPGPPPTADGPIITTETIGDSESNGKSRPRKDGKPSDGRQS